MELVWKLLRTKANTDNWTKQFQGGLRSAIAGRQYPQARVRTCGWAEHDRCLVCLSKLVDSEADFVSANICDESEANGKVKARSIRDEVKATPDQMARAPR